MCNNLLSIKERILLLAETLEVSKKEFFRKIDITYGNFTGDRKKRPVNSDAIRNILLFYPQTNPIWLLLGHGEMLLTNEQASVLYSNVELTCSAPNETEIKVNNAEKESTVIKDMQKTIKESLDTINGLAKENKELRIKLEKALAGLSDNANT